MAGGYRLGAGAELPPLLLDDAEAVAVAVGLRIGASGPIAGIEEISVRALTKLEQVMPSHLRRRVSALSQATSALTVDGPQIDTETLATLAAACRDTHRVHFALCRRRRHRTRCVQWIPPRSSTAGGTGTWSRLTSTATTGGPSESTESRVHCGSVDADSRGRCRAATRPRICNASCAVSMTARDADAARDGSACWRRLSGSRDGYHSSTPR